MFSDSRGDPERPVRWSMGATLLSNDPKVLCARSLISAIDKSNRVKTAAV